MDDLRPPSLDRLARYAVRIGVVIDLERTARGWRLLVDAAADLILDEMLVGYVKDNLGLAIEDDATAAPPGWRRLGLIEE